MDMARIKFEKMTYFNRPNVEVKFISESILEKSRFRCLSRICHVEEDNEFIASG